MNKRIQWTLIYVAYVAAFLAYWAIYGVALDFHARVLQGEDHLVEWLTFGGFAAACVMALLIVRQHVSRMNRRALAYFLLLALFFFACAGEELSWGQRLFGFKTPEKIASLNTQNEFNLHNLEFEHFHPKDVVSWFMKLFGILVPLALAWRMRRPDCALRRYVSPPALIPCFLFPELVNLIEPASRDLLVRFYGAAVERVSRYQTEEVIEAYWAMSVLLAMVCIHGAWARHHRPQAV